MLDINYIRENPDAVKENCRKRGCRIDVDELIKVDEERRRLIGQTDDLRKELNIVYKQKPSPEELEKVKQQKIQLEDVEVRLAEVEKHFLELMSWVPNMSSPNMPEGLSGEDNVELKIWLPDQGYLSGDKLGKGDNAIRYMPKKEGAKHHIEIGEELEIIDNKQSALTSGSRFYYLKGAGALLEYALFQLLSKKLLEEAFTPMVVPLLVKERVLFGTSHFPEGRDQIYKIESTNIEEQNELFLVGSTEPPLFAYYMDKVLKEEDLPQKMFAISPCFRSEVGSWGKDVRGIKRVHQFDKLEMDIVASENQSQEMFDLLLSINEWLLQQLKLPYRVINKCTRDCGYLATYFQYDVEVWLPGQQEFMEFGTDTNATDFQARRMNIKYTDREGNRRFAHTINDTGVTTRTVIAILDNFQQPDGSVVVPEVLRPYTGFDVIKPKK